MYNQSQYVVLLLVIVLHLFPTTYLRAQETKRIKILNADELIFIKAHDENMKRLIGHVKFKHENAIMTCDSAYFYSYRNSIDAFGHVFINQQDSVHLYCDFLNYNGMTKIAHTRHNIKLIHSDATLLTDSLDFDRNSNIAIYYSEGIIYNNEDTLISDLGYYHANSKDFFPVQNVIVSNPEFKMYTDSLRYNTEQDKAYFVSPTTVTTDSSELYCEKGWYLVKKDVGKFIKNASLKSKNHILYGDSLYYVKHTGIGEAYSNVKMIDTTENMIINGEYGRYYETADSGWVTIKAIFMNAENQGDTLFMHADTLMITKDSTHQHKQVLAYHHVKFYKTDLQGKCDSLSYALNDSIIRMYSNPIIWSDDYQLTAKYIEAISSHAGIKEIRMFNTGFIIQQKDTNKFNQIRGKTIYAYFNANNIYKVDVFTNALSVYYPEDDDAFIGMNNAESKNLTIWFENKKIKTVTYLHSPKGILYPLKDADASNAILPGFSWLEEYRPYNKDEIFLWQE